MHSVIHSNLCIRIYIYVCVYVYMYILACVRESSSKGFFKVCHGSNATSNLCICYTHIYFCVFGNMYICILVCVWKRAAAQDFSEVLVSKVQHVIYTYVYTYIYIYIPSRGTSILYTYVYTYTIMCVWQAPYTYICIYMFLRVSEVRKVICTSVCIYIFVCVRMYMYLLVCVCMYATRHLYLCTHIYVFVCVNKY